MYFQHGIIINNNIEDARAWMRKYFKEAPGIGPAISWSVVRQADHSFDKILKDSRYKNIVNKIGASFFGGEGITPCIQ